MEYNILFEADELNNKHHFSSFESNVSHERFSQVMSSLILLKVEFELQTFFKGEIISQTIKVFHQSKCSIFEHIKDMPIKY